MQLNLSIASLCQPANKPLGIAVEDEGEADLAPASSRPAWGLRFELIQIEERQGRLSL